MILVFLTTKQFVLILTLLSHILKKKTFSYRRIKDINFTQFNQDISVAFSNFEHLGLDSLENYFNSTLSSIFEKYAPLKTVTVTPLTSNPWFTSNLLNERCKRLQLERHWRKSGNESDKLLYKKMSFIQFSSKKRLNQIIFRLFLKIF